MKSEHRENGKLYEKFTWTINNISKHVSDQIKSEDFLLNGYLSCLVIRPRTEYDKNYYWSITLEPRNQLGWFCSRPKIGTNVASIELTLHYNYQLSASRTIVTRTIHNFDASKPFAGFINCGVLSDSEVQSFPGNHTGSCIVTAEMISVEKSDIGDQVLDSIISKNDLFLLFAPPNCNDPTTFVDFEGLGKVQKTFVPLLEGVCSLYPSLVEDQKNKNRTRVFTEWAFTALGRVLHFLKTKKVKDMIDEVVCKELEILWEELQICGFDLCWLEPHVISALGMKDYHERVAEVKRLKENVDAVENDLRIAKSKLAEAEGFIERDLEDELGIFQAP